MKSLLLLGIGAALGALGCRVFDRRAALKARIAAIMSICRGKKEQYETTWKRNGDTCGVGAGQ